jgi:type IV secretion system protein VirD4
LVLVSGVPPIRAHKLHYYTDRNFLARRLAPPVLRSGQSADAPPPRAHDWPAERRTTHPKLDKSWSEMVTGEEDPPRPRQIARTKTKPDRPHHDLPLFADRTIDGESPPQPPRPARGGDDDTIVQFPGGVRV